MTFLTHNNKPSVGKRLLWFCLCGLFFVLIGRLFRRFDEHNLASKPRPAKSYAEALERIEKLKQRDDDHVNPTCFTTTLLHGHPTERVFVLFHGYTNCPYQFAAFGQLLFERGFNVLLPRMPYHGYHNRLTIDQANLTAERLIAFTDETLDLARGLGHEVSVAGLSGGGSLAAWAAQQRMDLDQVMIIAPALGSQRARAWLTIPITRLMLALRTTFINWENDPAVAALRPSHSYPRFSTHALGQFLRLGLMVLDQARTRPPGCRRICVVFNPHDQAVNHRLIAKLIANWRFVGTPHLQTYTFPADWQLPHDLIDPSNQQQQVARVYPILIDLLLNPTNEGAT
jgi:esterase/lipase